MLLLQMVQRGRQDWDEAGYGPQKQNYCLDPQNPSVCYETIYLRTNHVEPYPPGNRILSTLTRNMNCKWIDFKYKGCLPKDTHQV